MASNHTRKYYSKHLHRKVLMTPLWMAYLKSFLWSLQVKGPYADHILIPRAQPEVVYFLISNESLYFSDCKSKISASNSL